MAIYRNFLPFLYFAPLSTGSLSTTTSPFFLKDQHWEQFAQAPLKFTTVSYELYSKLHDALMPKWDPKTVFPNKGLGMIGKIEASRRGTAVYRIVKVVSE